MNNESEKTTLKRSDSSSSIDSDDDTDLIAKLTKRFIVGSGFENNDPNDEGLFNKENVIKFLQNLLEAERVKNESASTQSEVNFSFEIENSKVSLNLDNDQAEQNLTDGLPRDLIVTMSDPSVFSNNISRANFEKLFLDIDDKCKFCHIRIFKRTSIQFSNPIAAILARVRLENYEFMGENLKMYLTTPIKLKNTRQYLAAPKNDKTFLISPPASPPVGWEQILEDPPVVNLDLLATLSSKLNPLEPCELIKSNNDMPGIIIHPCADQQDFFDNSNATRKFMPTRRPANDIN